MSLLIVFLEAFINVLGQALQVAIIIRVLLSWVPVRLPYGLGEFVWSITEPILGPIWVWAILGEHPGALALSGGVVVLAAVIANEVFAAYWARGTMAQPP